MRSRGGISLHTFLLIFSLKIFKFSNIFEFQQHLLYNCPFEESKQLMCNCPFEESKQLMCNCPFGESPLMCNCPFEESKRLMCNCPFEESKQLMCKLNGAPYIKYAELIKCDIFQQVSFIISPVATFQKIFLCSRYISSIILVSVLFRITCKNQGRNAIVSLTKNIFAR